MELDGTISDERLSEVALSARQAAERVKGTNEIMELALSQLASAAENVKILRTIPKQATYGACSAVAETSESTPSRSRPGLPVDAPLGRGRVSRLDF